MAAVEQSTAKNLETFREQLQSSEDRYSELWRYL